MSENYYTLTVSCPNRAGIVASVSQHLFSKGANIRESHQFDDVQADQFFMRVEFDFPDTDRFAELTDEFVAIAETFDMTWKMRPGHVRQRVLILVSKMDHCLVDLLYRWRTGDLDFEPVGIVSNHPLSTFAGLDFHGIPFDHIPVTSDTKQKQEAKLLDIVNARNVDLVVLARYMQILSSELAATLANKVINIHHSFLPGFKGARPYHQAYDRGVKVVGATAHFVTGDLDEGPIITQDVEPIGHRHKPEDLIRLGRDIERRVLAKAIHLFLEDRIFVHGVRTIIFEG